MSVQSYKQLTGKKIGVCVSGGLDSKTVSKRLKESNLDVLAFSADLGQPDEDDITHVRTRIERAYTRVAYTRSHVCAQASMRL